MPDTTLPAIPGSPPTGNKDQIAPLLGAEGAAVKKSSDHVSVVPHKSHKDQVSRSLEYIPEEILAALKKPEPLSKDLIKSRPLGGRAENAWFHGDVAKKYQHLIDYPPCSCGIGPRDISFLYDSVKNEERELPTPHIEDKGQGRKEFLERQAAVKRRAREGELPDTLIPKEFHLVQSKAALGLEYNKERFSLKTKDHEEHLTKFPSLKLVSRKEIIELRNVMDKMLSAVGVDDSADKQPLPTSAPGGPPTQMHSLLSLVKQEQDIYNVIFHEIIRQTTVECKERGEILAALRQRYANLLDKVPRQVRSMHAEVMAQRALDRRLTEELLKFKTAINSLTGELTDVREQEQKIAEQSRKAKEELKNSLLDSEKNASLLTEYHDLYELQRQRLEHQISVLSEEKEIWSTACYTMAVKITENNRLNTAKRLHMAEKTWAKLASHYALFLADRDCELMSNLQSHVDKWRCIISEMNYNIATGDKASKLTVMGLKDEVSDRCQTYQKTLLHNLAWDAESGLSDGSNSNLENKVVQPSAEAISRFHQDLKKWQEIVLNEVDKYSGDTLMLYQEQYALMKKEIELWNEIGQRVFARHVQEDGSRFPEHEKMITVNETIDKLMKQFNTLILGENGSAKFLIHLNNEIDQWEIKMHSLVNGAQSLSESDWLKFLAAVRGWPSTLETIISYMGKTRSFDQIGKPYKELTLEEALKAVQVWLASATNGIDNETQKIIEKVSSIHKSLIHWMVQILLRLAPDRPDNIADSYNASFSTMEQIEEQEVKLERSLLRFSEYLISCCGSAVMDPERGQTVDTDAEYRDLKKISKESTEWVNTAKIILQELKGDVIVSIGDMHATDRQDTLASTLSAPDSATQEVASSNADAPADEASNAPQGDNTQSNQDGRENASDDKLEVQQVVAEPKEVLQAICTDKNVRQFDLEEQRQQDVEVSTKILEEKADLGSQEDPKKAYESIAFVEQLQAQIIDTEKRAQSLEQRALEAEQKLQDALEQLREANTSLENVKRDAEREKERAEEEAEAEQAKKEDAEIAAQRARNAAASRGANRPAPESSQGSNASSRKNSVSSQQSQSVQARGSGSAKRGQVTARSSAGHKSSVSKK